MAPRAYAAQGGLSGNDGNEDATASATKCTYVWNEEVRDEIGVVAKPRDEIGFVVKPRDADADDAGGVMNEISVAKLRRRFGIVEKPLPRPMLGDTFNRVSPLLGLGRYAKSELKTVDEHKHVMMTLPLPIMVGTKKVWVAAAAEKSTRRCLLKKRLAAKTKLDDDGSDWAPPTHEECKLDAVVVHTATVTFIDEEIEGNPAFAGVLDSVG